jgi:hypothetical protein
MKKFRLNCLFLLLIVTNSSIIAQKEYFNFDDELTTEISYKIMPTSGMCNGEIEVLSLNGSAPFEYSIDAGINFQASPIFNGLCEKKYYLHIRDKDGKLGLALVNLTAAIDSYESVNLDKEHQVEDLKKELSTHAENSLEHRKIQWRLYKLNVPQTAYLTLISRKDNVSSYTLPVIFPDESQQSNFEANVQRVLSVSELKGIEMNYTDWIMTIRVDDNENNLDEILRLFGFSSFELIKN